jgi:hypothetical protein
MKSLRTATLTLYFFIGILIPACDWSITDDCNCDGYRYFNVTDLEVRTSVGQIEGEEVAPNQELRLEQFWGFYVDYLVDYHAQQQSKTDWSLSLMNSALACSCAVGYEGSKNQELVTFTVKTVNDFDAEHPAGSLINDLLQYKGSSYFADDQPLEDFLELEQQSKMSYEDMRLSINKAPTLDSLFQVEIVMELSTGERFEVQSTPFVLLPN